VISMEDSARRLGDAVLLRNGILYGPGTWYSPGGQVAAAARAGTLPADGDVTSFVHVDDAARAAVAALGWPAGTVNVVDDEPAAGSAWVPVFCAAVGAPVPSANPGRPHPWARGAVNGRARDLGWTPTFTSWRDGFAAEATVSTRGGRQCMPW
jgi:nucleoside-diphosphate-sugar epimerase